MTKAEKIESIDAAIADLTDKNQIVEFSVSRTRAIRGLKKFRSLVAASRTGFSDEAVETLIQTITAVSDKKIKTMLRDLYHEMFAC